MKNLTGYLFVFSFIILFTGELLSQNITYTYSWYKYYTPVDGKIIGIWPHPDRYNDISRLKELKYKWGFNYVVFWFPMGNNAFNMLKQAGYDPELNIMMNVESSDYADAAQYDKCWGYYLDEPEYKNISLSTVQTIKSWFNTNFPNVQFLSSGYKRDSYLKDLTYNIADQVLFSAYIHWWEFLGAWISWPVNPDQRDDWTDMKNLFGPKFTMTWISANQDLSEYNDLTGHALNLGLKGLWLFNDPNSPEVDDNNLESFCSNAADDGFLNVNYQQVRDTYVDGVFTGRQYVGPVYSSIPTTYDNSSLILTNTTVNDAGTYDYFATDSIVAGSPYFYVIPPSKESSFNSNNEIILKPGFEAQPGSEFRSYITK